MTVAGVVMAHEKRRAWAEELAASLDLPIVWDQVNDRHETGLRCLQAGLDSDSTHWLIVQDDAIVCRNLLAGLDAATEVSGDRVLGLYVGNTGAQNGVTGGRFATARASGSAWVAMPGPLWGVGIVIPTVRLPALVDHYSKSRSQNYDRRIEQWATAAKVECWYTMPSLVDHRTGEENPSLVPNRTSMTRHARWFIGADASALDVDWTSKPLQPTSGLWRRVGAQKIVRAAPGTSQARRYELSGQWEPVVESRCGECGHRKYEAALEAVCP